MSNVVLFSGGMDSTYMLYDLATTNPRDMIHAVTVIGHSFGQYQQKAEKKAREAVKKEFKRRKITNIQYHNIEVKSDFVNESFQMRFWLSYVVPNLKDGDKLNMAYLSSDGVNFFGTKPNLENAFEAMMKLRDIKCELNFIYQYWTKGDIIDKLKKTKLLKITSYCGQPKKDLSPCGKCMKCVSVKRWTKFPNSGIST